jgi:prepilin-type N-terminal cleavage/methylation domain-containing protein
MPSASEHSSQRSAFSLIEVMIALSMLAIIITALFSQMFTLQQSSEFNRQQASIRSLTLAMTNAFMGIPFERLRTAAAPWSVARYCPPATAVNPPGDAIAVLLEDRTTPLTDVATASANDCLLRFTSTGAAGLGLLDAPTGLRDLRVWIEYYRGSEYDLSGDGIIQSGAASGEVGLIDNPPTGLPPLMLPPVTYGNHLANFSPSALSDYRLATAPRSQADPEGTIVIRVVATYLVDSSATGNGTAATPFMTSFVIARRR